MSNAKPSTSSPISDREARLFAQVPANRDRFLAAIAERISPDRMQAVYLFPPIKHGAVETGVAVLAVDPLVTEPEPELELDLSDGTEPDVLDARAEMHDALVADDDTALGESDAALDGEVIAPPPPVRPVVFTARYRHTLKGADRGKWMIEIIEQADAPLTTVEMVVAGVTQRRDEATEPERLDAGAVRAAVAAGTWTTPTR